MLNETFAVIFKHCASIVTPTYLSSWLKKGGGDNLLSTVKEAKQKNIFAASSYGITIYFWLLLKSRNAPDFDWQISHTCGID